MLGRSGKRRQLPARPVSLRAGTLQAGSPGERGWDVPAGGGRGSTLPPALCRRGSLNVNLGVEGLPC